MKSLLIESQSGWIERFTLLKEKDDYILKIRQYKRGKENKQYYNEIHLFGEQEVKRLRDFLKKEVK